METEGKKEGEYSRYWKDLHSSLSTKIYGGEIMRIVYDLRDGKITEEEGHIRLEELKRKHDFKITKQ